MLIFRPKILVFYVLLVLPFRDNTVCIIKHTADGPTIIEGWFFSLGAFDIAFSRRSLPADTNWRLGVRIISANGAEYRRRMELAVDDIVCILMVREAVKHILTFRIIADELQFSTRKFHLYLVL